MGEYVVVSREILLRYLTELLSRNFDPFDTKYFASLRLEELIDKVPKDMLPPMTLDEFDTKCEEWEHDPNVYHNGDTVGLGDYILGIEEEDKDDE